MAETNENMVSIKNLEPDENGIVRVPKEINGNVVTVFDIGDLRWGDYTEIKKIIVPETINSILGMTSYSKWSNEIRCELEKIEIADDNSVYCSDGYSVFSKDKKSLLRFLSFTAEEYTIPDGTEIVAECAFCEREKLKRVDIPDSVKEIGKMAFYGCKELLSVNIPESVTEIPESAFEKCTSLTSIDIPAGVTDIVDRAFYDCGIEKITVPQTVKNIGEYAFEGKDKEITVYDNLQFKIYNEKSTTTKSIGYIGPLDNYYEIIVCSADTNDIKYKVWMSRCSDIFGKDSRKEDYSRSKIEKGWIGNKVSYDFSVLDKCYSEIKDVITKKKVAYNRLRYPIDLAEDMKETYVAYLVRNAKDYIKSFIEDDDMDALIFCESFGILKKNNIDEMIDYASKHNATQFLAYLLDYKNKTFGASKVSIKLPDYWAESKNNPGYVGRYKGNEVNVVFPVEVKGHKITGIADSNSRVPDNYKDIESVVIPQGYTYIGDYAFYGCKNLKSIAFPSSCIKIGYHAFEGCDNLKEIIIPCARFIGGDAFKNCKNLSKVKIIEKVNGIEKLVICEYAFDGCDSLKEVDLPNGMIKVCKGAFRVYGSYKLIVRGEVETEGKCFGNGPSEIYANETVMKNVYGIYQWMVKPLDELIEPPCDTWVEISPGYVGKYNGKDTKVVFPTEVNGNTIVGIADSTIRTPDNYKEIKSVVIPEGYTYIGECAFYGCENLESVTLPESLRVISHRAFEGCKKLKEIILPKNFEKIGGEAFAYCSSLSKVKFTNVSIIGGYAFADCNSLRVIDLPAEHVVIEKGAFEIERINRLIVRGTIETQGTCFGYPRERKIKEIYANIGVMKDVFGIDKSIIKPLEELEYAKDEEELISEPDKSDDITEIAGDYVIPDGTTKIKQYEYSRKYELTSVVIPEGVVSIGNYAFAYCENMTSVIIPKGIKEIKKGTFSRCLKLSNVVLPEGLKTIGEGAFLECEQLTNIEIPSTVESIEFRAFDGCRNLKSVELPAGVKKIGVAAFPEGITIIRK